MAKVGLNQRIERLERAVGDVAALLEALRD